MYKLLVKCLLNTKSLLWISCFMCLSSSEQICSKLEATHYICSQVSINVHKEPKELSEVLSQIIWSDAVHILEHGSNGWVKIATHDFQEGWVHSSSLIPLEDSTYPRPSKVAMVISREARIYLVRDVKMYPPLLCLPYGAKLEIVSSFDVQADRWAQVRLINGEIAYIQRSDIVINPQALTVAETISLAKSFVGIPYTWGGNTVYGFDSPGFIQMLYRQMGLQLPREAASQAEMPQMNRVDLSKLEPGDLLFFSLSEDGVIDHVGMYLGNKEFLHASAKNSPPSVQITSINTPYWQICLKYCGKFTRN